MKGTVLILLCALALTQASQSQRNSDGTKTCNCNPSEAQTICSDYASDGILIAHENCNKFYQCFDGRPIAFSCPSTLLYNPVLELCDWPQNVDCGDRPIIDGSTGGDDDCDEDNDNGQTEDKDSDSNGNGNDENSEIDDEDCEENEDNSDATCNCNPSEAPNICKNENSDGVLVAHENCNQFYKCFDGAPVTIDCPTNLLYNPRLEMCDWPEKVDCGDRVKPDGTEDSGNDDRDNDDRDNGGSDNNDNENVGAGNCDPSEAPAICASEGSNGVLVAHENCNQFYICSYGKPVPMKCPGNLLFNPNSDQCDWPENVECGDRVIPDGIEDSDNGGSDNGGSDNGGSDNGGSDNGGVDNGGSDNGGSDNDGTDNGGTDNGGSDNGGNDNIGAGNCDPSEAPAICASEGSNGVLVAHENCNQFYICSYGKPVGMRCPGNLLFNPNTDQCDWPENVDCGERLIPDENDNGGSDNGGSDNGGSDNGGSDNGGSDNGGSDNGGTDNGGNENVGAGNCDPSEAPSICAAEGSDDVLVAHENCNQFYICSNGKPVALKCPGTLLFNPKSDQCDWPDNVDCGERVIPDETNNGGSDNGGSDNGGSDNGGSDNGGSDNGGSDNGGSDNGGNDNVGAGNCDPSEAPAICASEGSNGVLVAHENCNKFYMCSNGKPVALKCPGTLLFNPKSDQCDWPDNVDCGERVIPDETDNGGSDNGGNDNGGSDNGGSDNGGGDNGGSDNGGSDNGESDNGGNDNVGAGNGDPSEAPSICAAEGSDGVLVAHENCNQFYICSNGKPVALKCPGTLLFNPKSDQCDWPDNVDCGERVIPDETDNGGSDNGGNDNGGSDNGGSDNGGSDNGGSDNGGSDNGGNDNVGAGNCDPSEAPAICASEGSNGVLVAHENCNKFYMCSNGRPVALKCPGTLLFNPKSDQCDWPDNVVCGERVIPDETDNGGSDNGSNDNGGSDNGGSDNGGGDNGGSDNGGSDNGESDNGGNDNVGAGNGDPSEAPSICAAEGSDGVLVAHENCNQFYICSNGKPVALKCPGTLLFNPKSDQCDWPDNVDCGERVIPDETDNGGSDNGGNDNGGSDNGGSDNGGSDNGGSDNGGSDNGGNDNVGAGNCDPSEAPAICASEGSNGVLVAHENCNKFYMCSNGKPVALKCPGTLLFNPKSDQCDWPDNVVCGERVIPDETDNGGSDNGSNDNGGSDNGGSDNGGGDNGGSDNGGSDNGESDNGGNDNVGAGNGDPSEAPSICAAEGSDGVLVAHENCNKFYMCSNGQPVALKCPGSLLFNPKSDRCDWPDNVDCGERVIPDETDNGGSDNGGSDNGGSDNGGSDNGGSDNGGIDNGGSDNGGSENGGNDNVGAGNCDPSEAPAICASEGSNGVLVAHENCNQFYKCSYGKPVALQCPGNLLFNPNTDQCDWPENVECGSRVIPDGTEDSDNGGTDNDGNDNDGSDNGGSDNEGSDNEGSDNGGSDNGGSDIGGSDNGGSENVGAGNCDPSEAPAICASEGSNGVLVAHENCNQFYKCSYGNPVALTCPGNLLFNPSTDQCDWPENVECNDRVIPDGTEDSDNGGTDNGGTDNGGTDNGGTDNGGTDNGGTDNGGTDNGGSDTGGSGSGDGASGGNSDPSEAATICGSAGSNGVLVAHEKCNKFYMCSDGSPVPILCSSNLLFNPSLGVCDWPRNVDCGDRVIPESEDTCLCNSRQAPAICSGERSNGLLIAHEYCNQYYVCVDGSPVARSCPLNHLYNPHEAACDWAQNVSCDEREVSYSLNKHVDVRQTIRF